MHRIAVVGLKKNSTIEFYNDMAHYKKELDIDIVPFIYSHKTRDLYDRLEQKGFSPADFTAAISVGGDGTFLYTSRVFAGYDVAVFGINKGHLGFNTNIEEREFDYYFRSFLNGNAKFEYKSLLDVYIEGDSSAYIVLNEGVVTHSGISRPVRLKVCIDSQEVCDYRGDGLIVSTPTGSTAYNLSAGGPILHPSVDAYVICPICPHTLAIRPYIVPYNEIIHVTVEDTTSQPQITLDGQKIILLDIGQKIIFKKSEKKVKIVRGNKTFTEILETKLGWMM